MEFFFVAATVIVNKWNNLRDTFKKSLKTQSGQAHKKAYLYSDHMQFLLKTLQPDETVSNIAFSINDDSDTNEPGSSTSTCTELSRSCTPASSRKIKLNLIDEEILKALKTEPRRDERLDDEDQAFLFFILPTMKRVKMTN